MREQLDYNIRCGKHINIAEELDELEAKYKADLLSTINSFDSADEVSNETLNDQIVFTTVIRMMCKFGYLDDEECKNICECAGKIRLQMLEGGASNE